MELKSFENKGRLNVDRCMLCAILHFQIYSDTILGNESGYLVRGNDKSF